MAWILALALQDPRVTLELPDVSLEDAHRRVLEPFGQSTQAIWGPERSKRVRLSLRDAGYLGALDALSALAGWEEMRSPFHPALEGPGAMCGNAWDGFQTLQVADLSPSFRLIVAREAPTLKERFLCLILVGPPGQARTPARFEGSVSGEPLRDDAKAWHRRPGEPSRFGTRSPYPFLRAGDVFELRGIFTLPDGRRLACDLPAIELPPHRDFPDSGGQGPWLFLIGGLTLGLILIVSSAALLRKSPTSEGSSGSGS